MKTTFSSVATSWDAFQLVTPNFLTTCRITHTPRATRMGS